MASDVSLLEPNAELMELASAVGLAKPPDAESERLRANAPPPMMTRTAAMIAAINAVALLFFLRGAWGIWPLKPACWGI